MISSTIDQKVKRVKKILERVDVLNTRARLLMALIETEGRKEKDKIRYGGIFES